MLSINFSALIRASLVHYSATKSLFPLYIPHDGLLIVARKAEANRENLRFESKLHHARNEAKASSKACSANNRKRYSLVLIKTLPLRAINSAVTPSIRFAFIANPNELSNSNSIPRDGLTSCNHHIFIRLMKLLQHSISS